MSDQNRRQKEPDEFPVEVKEFFVGIWQEAPLRIRLAIIVVVLAIAGILYIHISEFIKTGKMPS
jgi:hypothetical protein